MFLKALPFAVSFTLTPLVVMSALYGGYWIMGPFVWGWVCISLLDRALGKNTQNMDPATADSTLFWHSLITWIWVPIQMVLMALCLYQATHADHLTTWEAVGVMGGLGVATGGIGINFAHELVHQRNRWERTLGEWLLHSVAYGPFATEHVYGHHITVATPKDPVTARKGQSFLSFFPQAVIGTFVSAWEIDRDRLARRGLPIWHKTNPFWRYALGAGLFIGIAAALGGWWGVMLFFVQALMAIYQLEAVNYTEHYGLTRRYLGNGAFERVKPCHSWNAAQTFSNWMLINLQRHSDHHYRPSRRYPLLQHYAWKDAPQLPFGYPLMVAMAVIPPLWFAVMNPRVDRWRAKFYPDIDDWTDYDNGTHDRTEPGAQVVPAE
ncbi:MAG: alkane 1-monooxygenase [Pseudomonadota bacterium]